MSTHRSPMRFEVRHPGGTPHEVDIASTIAVLGRDPSSDVVLNDPKCSRRHAVVEVTPEGVVIRDAGSSNGIHLNGKRVERSPLASGDVVRLGDVTLTVLSDAGGTLVVGPDSLEDADPTGATPSPALASIPASGGARSAPPASSPRAPLPPRPDISRRTTVPDVRPSPGPSPAPAPSHSQAASQAPRPARPAPNPSLPRTTQAAREPLARPLFLSTLAILWALSTLIYLGGAVAMAIARAVPSGLSLVATVVVSILGVGVAIGMAIGIWMRSRWARWAQVALSALGLLNCPFSLASGLVLFYVLRPAAAVHFSGRRNIVDLEPNELALVTNDSSETILTVALLGLVALGVFASAALAFWVYHSRP